MCAAESDAAAPFAFGALYQAYEACRRRKRGSRSTQRYELRLLDHLVGTGEALREGRWSPGRSACFITRSPKAREVHAADFADRVVHHWLVPRLERWFEPVFIHDSYANRQGKGTHAAVQRLQTFMRRASINGRREAWFLQLDVRSFFNSIDRELLGEMIRQRLGRVRRRADASTQRELDACLWLTQRLMQTDPARSVIRRGPAAGFDRVPPHKRLSGAAPGCGLPIGNLTSQFFANVYLNELDQFVKHRLGCRCYLRYVDDLVLVHTDPAQLAAWCDDIRLFLGERLGLSLKDEGVLAPLAQGCDFLGYVVRPGYLLVRRRVVGHLVERLLGLQRELIHTTSGGVTLRLAPEPRDRLRAVLASYLGHFGHARRHRLIERLWARFPWLGVLFESPLASGRLAPRWEPAGVSSLASQWRWVKRRWPGHLCVIQVGTEFMAAGPDAGSIEAVPRMPCRGRAAERGALRGLAWGLGALTRIRTCLRRAGLAHVFVAEEGWLRGGMKRRRVRLVWTLGRMRR